MSEDYKKYITNKTETYSLSCRPPEKINRCVGQTVVYTAKSLAEFDRVLELLKSLNKKYRVHKYTITVEV